MRELIEKLKGLIGKDREPGDDGPPPVPERPMRLSDFLTQDEVEMCAENWKNWKRHQRTCTKKHGDHDYAEAVTEKIIRPNLSRIEKALGQKCDPVILGICVEAVMQAADAVDAMQRGQKAKPEPQLPN